MSRRKTKIIWIWYPYPFSTELREWVIGFKPRQIHKLVIQRLRARTNLIHETRDILLSRALTQEELLETIQSTIHHIERLTIEGPTIHVPELENRTIKLLPDKMGESPYYGSFPYPHPSFLEKFDIDVRWNFVQKLLKHFYDPIPRYFHFLQEHADLKTEFGRRKDDADCLLSLLKKWEVEANRIQIGEMPLNLSRKTINRVTKAKTPSQRTYLILAHFHGTNPRVIKEMLHTAKQENLIVKSWSLYDDWIHKEKSRVSKLIDLLTP